MRSSQFIGAFLCCALTLSAVSGFCADETSVGQVDFNAIVDVETELVAPGKLIGKMRNTGPRTVRDIVVLVKHNWVWTEGRSDGDSYSHSEYIRIDRALVPGDQAAFASVHTPVANVPEDANYFSDVKVSELTEIRYASEPK